MSLMTSTDELAPFGDEAMLDDSCAVSLGDMAPVAPTIDIKETHVYTLQDNKGKRTIIEFFRQFCIVGLSDRVCNFKITFVVSQICTKFNLRF